jgi:hypothetical protein
MQIIVTTNCLGALKTQAQKVISASAQNKLISRNGNGSFETAEGLGESGKVSVIPPHLICYRG